MNIVLLQEKIKTRYAVALSVVAIAAVFASTALAGNDFNHAGEEKSMAAGENWAQGLPENPEVSSDQSDCFVMAGTAVLSDGETFSSWNLSLKGTGGNATNLIAGGSLRVVNGAFIGNNNNSGAPYTGTIVMTNGTADIKYLHVGRDGGFGELYLSGGVLTLTGTGDAMNIPWGSGLSRGYVQVSQTGTLKTVANSNLRVGSGDGTETSVLDILGGLVEPHGDFTIGSYGKGIVYLKGGVLRPCAGVYVGNGSNNNGNEANLAISGGVFDAAGREIFVGDGTTSTSAINISGGTVDVASIHIGRGVDSQNNTVTVSGGTVTCHTVDWYDAINIGWKSGSTGVLNITGGRVVVDDEVYVARGDGGSGATGTLTISGDGELIGGSTSDNALHLTHDGCPDGTAIVNLDGGRLVTRAILKGTASGSTATVNLNGGTISPTVSNSGFLNAADGLSVVLKSGGVTFDTAGFDITVGATLSDDANAVTKGGIAKRGLGTLTISSGLELGRTFTFAIGACGIGPVALAGSNALDGKIAVEATLDGVLPGETYTLMTGLDANYTIASNFTPGSAPTGYKYTWNASGGTLTLLVEYADDAVATAEYENGSWICKDAAGNVISGGAPNADTAILLKGSESASALAAIAQTTTLAKVSGSVQLLSPADWSGLAVHLASDAVLDLNGCDLVLGSYYAASGAKITDSRTGAGVEPSVLTLGANDGVMGGNAAVSFSGALTVKVTGGDDTGFQTTVQNTHVGGWIFKDNNYNITLRYDTFSMGTGTVVFDGNGGFSSYNKQGENFYENVSRLIVVNGTGNHHVTTDAGVYHEFLRYAALSGNGELTLSGKDIPEIGSNPGCFTDFRGRLVVKKTMLFWDSSFPENCTVELQSGGDCCIRSDVDTICIKIGDLATDVSTFAHDKRNLYWYWGEGKPATWEIGAAITDQSHESTFAGTIWHKQNLVKKGKGTWNLNAEFARSEATKDYAATVAVEDGRLNFGGAFAGVATPIAFNVVGGVLGIQSDIPGLLTVGANGTVAFSGGKSVGSAVFASGATLSIGAPGSDVLTISSATDPISVAGVNASVSDNASLVHNGAAVTVLASNVALTGSPSRTVVEGVGGTRWRLVVSDDSYSLLLKECPSRLAVVVR